MELLIIDAQGGGIGKQLAASVKKAAPELLVTAVGTNSAATAAMLRAGGPGGHRGKRRHRRVPPGGRHRRAAGAGYRRRPSGGNHPRHGPGGGTKPGQADSYPGEPLRQYCGGGGGPEHGGAYPGGSRAHFGPPGCPRCHAISALRASLCSVALRNAPAGAVPAPCGGLTLRRAKATAWSLSH